MPSTALLALPYPQSTDADDVPLYLQNLATAVEVIFADQGVKSARPSTALRGRRYYATDEGQEYRGDGTSWQTPGVSKAGGSTILASGAAVVPLVLKAAAAQSAFMLDVQDSTGASMARIGQKGTLLLSPTDTSHGPLAQFTNSNPAAVSVAVKGAAAQSFDLQQWLSSASAVLAKVDASGYLTTGQAAVGAGVTGVAWLNVVSPASGVASPLAVFRGGASQTGNLTEWRDSTNAVLGSVNSGGALAAAYVFAGPSASGVTPSQAAIIPVNASTRGLTIKGAVSQAADHVRLLDSSNNTLAQFRSDGRLQLRPSADGVDLALDAGFTVSPRVAGGIGVVIAGLVSQTGDHLQIRSSATTVLAAVNGAGSIIGNVGVYASGAVNADPANYGYLNAFIQSATHRGALIRGAASQSGDLQQWQNSAGSVLARVDAAGNFIGGAGTAVAAGFINDVATTGSSIALQPIGANAGAVAILSRVATGMPLMVKGFTAQSADLQQWQNSAGSVLSNVASNGALSVGVGGNGAYLLQVVNAGSTAQVLSRIQGVSGQAGDLQQWQSSAGAVLLKVTSSGQLAGPGAAKTLRIPHTFTIAGPVAVASGATDYIPPMFVSLPAGQTATIAGARHSTRGGSCTWTVSHGSRDAGTSVTGLAAVSSTTTTATTSATGTNTLADGEAVQLVVNSITGSPDDLTVTVFVDYVVA